MGFVAYLDWRWFWPSSHWDRRRDRCCRGDTEVTKEQQNKIDEFHERAIDLIFKQRRAQKYNDWPEEERITKEIFKIEDDRRAYELECHKKKEPKIVETEK